MASADLLSYNFWSLIRAWDFPIYRPTQKNKKINLSLQGIPQDCPPLDTLPPFSRLVSDF